MGWQPTPEYLHPSQFSESCSGQRPLRLPDDFPVWSRLGYKITFRLGPWSTIPQSLPPNLKKVPVTLMNTNSYNVWIKQPLLAANIVEVDHCPWDYHSTMSHDGGEVQVSFYPVPTPDVQADVLSVGVTQTELQLKAGETDTWLNGGEQRERPKFGPRPKFNSKDFDFKQELARLPFPVNIREVELSPCHNRNISWSLFTTTRAFSCYAMRTLGLCDWPQAYHSDYSNETSLLATPYNSSSVANWGSQMSGYLAQTRNYMSISQPVCVTSGYSS